MDKEIRPKELSTPNSLEENGRSRIGAALNSLVADGFALYVKLKNFHWHASGSHFRDYHLLFDEHAEQIFAMIDPLAERVRKLGGTTIRSINHITRLQTIKDDDEPFIEPQKMIKSLVEDNQKYAASIRHSHKVCETYQDIATCSLLELFLDETEKRIWFLFAITATQ